MRESNSMYDGHMMPLPTANSNAATYAATLLLIISTKKHDAITSVPQYLSRVHCTEVYQQHRRNRCCRWPNSFCLWLGCAQDQPAKSGRVVHKYEPATSQHVSKEWYAGCPFEL